MKAPLTLALPMLLVAPACDDEKEAGGASTAQGEALPQLDAKAAADALEALANAPEEARSRIAMTSLATLERGRLDDGFVALFRTVAESSPEMRINLIAKAVSENTKMFEAACRAEVETTFQELEAAAPGKQMPLLWSICDLQRHGLITEQDAATSDVAAVILAHMAFAHIEAHGGAEPDERKLLEMAARLPAGTPPPG